MTPNVFCKRLVGWLDLFNAELSPETLFLHGPSSQELGRWGLVAGRVGWDWGGVG